MCERVRLHVRVRLSPCREQEVVPAAAVVLEAKCTKQGTAAVAAGAHLCHVCSAPNSALRVFVACEDFFQADLEGSHLFQRDGPTYDAHAICNVAPFSFLNSAGDRNRTGIHSYRSRLQPVLQHPPYCIQLLVVPIDIILSQ